jgi:endonuclease YncB( thermonuclease family)
VTLATRSQASDGVQLAEIIPNGSTVPVNLLLVEAGMAMVYHTSVNRCDAERYKQAELKARSQRIGIWGASPGSIK